METITNLNLAVLEPLTELNAGTPVRYVGCNLTNRRVHADSEVVDCQESQIVFDDGTPHRVGRGVRGEVTAVEVQAVRDAIGGGA
ncbi:MAG: hypothetical protein ACOC7R_00200 [Planctomycetota bacterium]